MTKSTYNIKIPFSVTRSSSKTLVRQTIDGLRVAILNGYYRPGDVLPTTRDLARRLGVSTIVTEAAVKAIAAEGLTNPRPRIGSVVLGRRERVWRGHVLFVSPESAGFYYFNQFADAFQGTLVEEGYLLTRFVLRRSPKGDYRFEGLDLALQQSVDLVVLMYDTPEIERYLSRFPVPFIVIGNMQARPGTHCVGCVRFNREAAVPTLVERCRAQGVKSAWQVGFVRGGSGRSADAMQTFRDAGISADEIVVLKHKFDGRPAEVQRAALETFAHICTARRFRLPDLLFVTDDYVASGILTAFDRFGIRIPNDVRFVCWANSGLGPVYHKELTRMEADPVRHGHLIADAAVRFLLGGDFRPDIEITPTWVDGETF